MSGNYEKGKGRAMDLISRQAHQRIRFPVDCPYDCPYIRSWDMSIDDYTYVCDALGMQIDGCDTFFKSLLPYCPIEKRGEHDAEVR